VAALAARLLEPSLVVSFGTSLKILFVHAVEAVPTLSFLLKGTAMAARLVEQVPE
jgi:hypothetical protein